MKAEIPAFRRRVRTFRLVMWLVVGASRLDSSSMDRLRLANRRAAPRNPERDFMRDEIVDADIGFTVLELDALHRGAPEQVGSERDRS